MTQNAAQRSRDYSHYDPGVQRRGWRREWQPTEAAQMLWLYVVAIFIGWLAYVLFGHPIALTP